MTWCTDLIHSVITEFTPFVITSATEPFPNLAVHIELAGPNQTRLTIDVCPSRLEFDVTLYNSLNQRHSLGPIGIADLNNFECGIHEAHSDPEKLRRFIRTAGAHTRQKLLPLTQRRTPSD